jgi:hypothetical protein
MESLVKWKKKVSLYRDEADDDDLGPRSPKLTDTMQPCAFIMRDETNAESMKKLNENKKKWDNFKW